MNYVPNIVPPNEYAVGTAVILDSFWFEPVGDTGLRIWGCSSPFVLRLKPHSSVSPLRKILDPHLVKT